MNVPTISPTTSVSLAISEPNQVGEARRAAVTLATRQGMSELEAARAGLIATEAATNLHKHAGTGRLLLRPLQEGDRRGIEIVTVDRGPGMADIAKCLEDGYSTHGTPGNGLGTIQRAASFLEIYSVPHAATVLLAQVWDRDGAVPRSPFVLGAVCIPVRTETLCGDAWMVRRNGDRLLLLMSDGLGHGAPAAQASAEAIRLFSEQPFHNAQTLLQTLHLGLRPTRGAAAMILDIDLATGAIACAGIGNISARLLGGGVDRSFVSQNGIVGHQAKHFQEFAYSWPTGSLLILHSDGLQSRLSLDKYPGLQVRHPGVVAAILHQNFHREHDDSTVLVLRRQTEAAA